MKEHLLKELEDKLTDKVTVDDIDFVLTVPAIWDDTAKMFMREAAIQVWLLFFSTQFGSSLTDIPFLTKLTFCNNCSFAYLFIDVDCC